PWPRTGAPPGPGNARTVQPAAAAPLDLPTWAGGPAPALVGFVPWPYGQAVAAVVTAAVTDGPVSATGWTRPVDSHHPVSAEYGTPGSWQAGYHTGVDFALPEGEPIRSVGPGTVVVAGDSGDYGETVVVRMEDGHHVLYAHLSSVAVAVGDTVRGGQEIGKSGNTGRSTGPHLHFEVRKGREYGTDVDPVEYLRRNGVDI
ncbi:M23 family metallopeptidase, partial [Streptomyces spiramenti]